MESKIIKVNPLILLLAVMILQFVVSQDFDYDEGDGRRLHRRKKPQNGGGGPCGRSPEGDGRFFALQYLNLNYNYNCGGGGGGGYYPQQGYLGGGQGGFGGGGGHKPQKPQKPHRPGHHQGGGGGFGGSHGGGGFGGSHGGGLGSQGGGGSHGGQGGLLGGIFGGNRPQTVVQDVVSGVGDVLSKPPFTGGGDGGGGNGGLFGFGLFDGSIINSFTSLFTNNNQRPPADTGVQFQQDIINNNNDNTNNNDNNNNNDVIVDEKPVHEDHDEIPEVYTNKLRNGQYVSASSPFGGYGGYGGGGGHGGYGGFGGFNYNKAIKKVNRQINSAIRPLYSFFRR